MEVGMCGQLPRIIKLLVSAAAFAGCLSSETSAAERDQIASSGDWDGVSIGASVGGALTYGSTSVFTERDTFFGGVNNLNTSTDTKTGGEYNEAPTIDAFLRFNRQITSNLVTGLQLEGSLADIDFSSHGTALVTCPPPGCLPLNAEVTRVADTRLHRSISVLGRLGWLRNPGSMFYGLLGWTYGRFEIELLPVIDTATVPGGGAFAGANLAAPDIEKNAFGANGISLGGGFEKKLGNRWSVQTEYRYLYFADINHNRTKFTSKPIPAGKMIDVQNGEFENEMHSLRVGVVYHLPIRR